MACPWTDAELRFAATQRAAGIPLKVVAKHMPGRSWQSIKSKLDYEAEKATATPTLHVRTYAANDLLAAKAQLAAEIAAAKREWRTAPLYKPEVRA